MAEPITVRLSNELQAKLSAEAEQKESSISQIIRDRIEQSYAQEETKELKQKLSGMEARVIETAPQARRAEHLSWWTLTLLAEFLKHEFGLEKFRAIERTADEKYELYQNTRELNL